MQLANEHTVYFVTEDKGFYSSKDYSKGLAENLREQAAIEGLDIKLYSGIAGCLRELSGEEPEYDKATLGGLIEENCFRPLEQHVSRSRMEIRLAQIQGIETSVFRTDRSHGLAVDFLIVTSFEPENEERWERSYNREVLASGTCFFNTTTLKLENVFLDNVVTKWKTVDGGYGKCFSSLGGDPSLSMKPDIPRLFEDP